MQNITELAVMSTKDVYLYIIQFWIVYENEKKLPPLNLQKLNCHL